LVPLTDFNFDQQIEIFLLALLIAFACGVLCDTYNWDLYFCKVCFVLVPGFLSSS